MLNKVNEFMPIGEHNFDQDALCSNHAGFRNWCHLRQIFIHNMDEELLIKDKLTHDAMAQIKKFSFL